MLAGAAFQVQCKFPFLISIEREAPRDKPVASFWFFTQPTEAACQETGVHVLRFGLKNGVFTTLAPT